MLYSEKQTVVYALNLQKVTGDLDDCDCDVETIDSFNNDQLFPKLQTLLESDYFRFYKVTGPYMLTRNCTHTRGCDPPCLCADFSCRST